MEDNVNSVGEPGKVNQDELIIAQEKEIADDIKNSYPLVGPLENICTLQKEFENDPVYLNKVSQLQLKFSKIRRTRPDGNCFLRGFIFAYLDFCVHNRPELARIFRVGLPSYPVFVRLCTNIVHYVRGLSLGQLNLLKKYLETSKTELLNMGFPKFTTEDFFDMFMEVVTDLEENGNTARVESICNDAGTSDYLVVYLKLLISSHLQKNADFFSCFIEGGRSVDEFCKQEVEPMYRECDHLHIVALTGALDIGVSVTYLDRGRAENLAIHNFPEEKEPIFYMLYRPNHYDLLFKT